MEAAAADRRARLKALRAQALGEEAPGEPSEKRAKSAASENDNAEEVALKLRNYTPSSDLAAERIEPNTDDQVEKAVAERLKQIEEEDVIQEITEADTIDDVLALAPRKVDWDLKRDLEEKFVKLEQRTKRSIIKLIRHRLQDEDEASKFAAVKSAAMH